MTNHKSGRIAFATALLATVMAASSHAWSFNHENRFTFSKPVALPGVVLPAGEYLFDVASPTALDVVVVRNSRSGKVLYMGFTNIVQRPKTLSNDTPITFSEAPASEPRPISTWYEIGQSMGHQFLYR